MIVGVPDKRYPWHILLVVEFVQVLHQESLVLQLQVEDTQTPLILGSTNKVPSSKRFSLIMTIFPPKALSLDSLQLLDDTSRDVQRAKEINRH